MIGFNGGLIGAARETSNAQSVPGVWTPQEQLKAKRAYLWPPNSGEDPYIANVSLLLRGNGTNGSTTFTDNSLNSFAITANGSAQISTAQSKYGGASMYFPGSSSSYLSTPSNAAFQFGTGDFTIEFWVYLTGSGSLFSNATNLYANNCLNCRLYSSGTLDFYTNGGTEYTSISSAVTASTWTHLAFVRSGNTVTIYKNGTSIGSNANWGINLNLTNFYINGGRDGNGEKYYDDFRITKGVARYTSNFTPPGEL